MVTATQNGKNGGRNTPCRPVAFGGSSPQAFCAYPNFVVPRKLFLNI